MQSDEKSDGASDAQSLCSIALKLINCEATFTEKNGKKEYYINEFGEMDYTDSGYILKHSL